LQQCNNATIMHKGIQQIFLVIYFVIISAEGNSIFFPICELIKELAEYTFNNNIYDDVALVHATPRSPTKLSS